MDLHVTQFEKREHVGTIRLNRPGRGNSWTHRMNAEYRWLMQACESDSDVRVIVVTGAGRQFCVGADFKALDHHSASVKPYDDRHVDDMAKPGYGVDPAFDDELVWQWGLSKPVIAAINGACAGIAVALAAFCDLRYGAAGAKITTSTARLGLPAEYGLSWLLPRIVGLGPAADLLMTGRVALAEEMHSIRFLNAVFPVESFEAEVSNLARGMARRISPAAVRNIKRQLYLDQLQSSPALSVAESRRLTALMLKQPDFKEGVSAAQEKRPASFSPLGQ